MHGPSTTPESPSVVLIRFECQWAESRSQQDEDGGDASEQWRFNSRHTERILRLSTEEPV